MPLYEVRSLEVRGNPVEEYEVISRRPVGEVYIRPESGDVSFDDPHGASAFETEVIVGLMQFQMLDEDALEALGQSNLRVMTDGGLLWIEEYEEAFVKVTNPDEAEYEEFIERVEHPGTPRADRRQAELQADVDEAQERNRVNQGDEVFVETREGFRPRYQLVAQPNVPYVSEDGIGFWDDTLYDVKNHKVSGHELHLGLGYDVDEKIGARIVAEVIVTHHNRPGATDRFVWPLEDWQRRPSLGWDPLTSTEMHPTKAQLEAILVALDQYLEQR